MIIYKPEPQKLIVPISDSAVGGFKREVEFIGLNYYTGGKIDSTPEQEEVTKFLSVKFIIHYFELIEQEITTLDELGQEVTTTIEVRRDVKSLSSEVQEDTFIADYKTYVELATGRILAKPGENLETEIAKLVTDGVYTQAFVDSNDFVVVTQIDYFELAFNREDPNNPQFNGMIPIKPMLIDWANNATFKDIEIKVL